MEVSLSKRRNLSLSLPAHLDELWKICLARELETFSRILFVEEKGAQQELACVALSSSFRSPFVLRKALIVQIQRYANLDIR